MSRISETIKDKSSLVRNRGGCRIFARGGAELQKKNLSFVDVFLVDQIDFPKNLKKKQVEKGVIRHFLENFDKELRFFGTPSPLKF